MKVRFGSGPNPCVLQGRKPPEVVGSNDFLTFWTGHSGHVAKFRSSGLLLSTPASPDKQASVTSVRPFVALQHQRVDMEHDWLKQIVLLETWDLMCGQTYVSGHVWRCVFLKGEGALKDEARKF